MGSVVAREMRQSSAAMHAGVQIKGTPFFRRFKRGCTISARPEIKAQ
jgi:hypothetical protein